MTDWIKTHHACPECDSSDGASTNADGWITCFSCDNRFPPKDRQPTTEYYNVNDYKFDYIPQRDISSTAFRHYKAATKLDKEGNPIETCFPYPHGGFQKIRSLIIPKKDPGHFRTVGTPKEAGLFGQDKFQPGSSDTIIITEGEYDAIASYDMCKLPSVSVASSSSARRDIENAREYLNSFSRIVFAFDNDEVGQKAVQKCAGIFDFNKTYVVDMGKYKDANDFRKANDNSGWAKAVKLAKKFTPDSITNTFAGMREQLKQKNETRIGTYPFKRLQDMLFGIYQGEVVLIRADTGIGKTEWFRAMEFHNLKHHESTKHCVIHLEEGNDTTIRGLATYQDEFPYIHLNDETDDEVIMAAVEKLVQDESRVNIYESFDVEDENKLLDTIRYLVKVCGVNMVWLDHISWLATGKDDDADERRKLDRISQKIKLMAKELHFAFIMISHTNDDGRTRGSRNIEKVANTGIDLWRDKEAEGDEKHKLWMSVWKGRGHGTQTGKAGYAFFDTNTLTLKCPYQNVDRDLSVDSTPKIVASS